MPTFNNKKIAILKQLKRFRIKTGIILDQASHNKIKLGLAAGVSCLGVLTFTLGLLLAVNPRLNLAKTIDSENLKLNVTSSLASSALPTNLTAEFNFIPTKEVSSSSSSSVNSSATNNIILTTSPKNFVPISLKFKSPAKILPQASMVVETDTHLKPLEESLKYTQNGKTLKLNTSILNVATNEIHYGINTDDQLISSIEPNTEGELSYSIYIPEHTADGSYSISSRIINATSDANGKITATESFASQVLVIKVVAGTNSAGTSATSAANSIGSVNPDQPNSLKNIDDIEQQF